MLNKITRLKIFLVFLVLAASCSISSVFAQTGEIRGIIVDEKGAPLDFASVTVLSGEVAKASINTDLDGSFVIKPLDAGTYDVKITYVGFQAKSIIGVIVNNDKPTILGNIVLAKPNQGGIDLGPVTITYQKPLIKVGGAQGADLTRKEIASAATRNLTEVASANTPGAYQKEGKGIQFKGGRENSTRVIVDGVQIRGGMNLPQGSVEGMSVITGGMPAKYGDAIGGIITVTTRGASKKFTGAGEFVTSMLLDKYGYNLASLNFNGPILFKKGADAKNKKPLLGYNVSIEYEGNKDPNPSAVGIYKVNADKLAEIEQTPLMLNPKTGFGYIRTADFVTKDDMELVKAKLNARTNEVRLASKIDWNLNDNMNVTVGGNFWYKKSHNYIREYSLFNFENNPEIRENNWRVFARFSHRLDKPQVAAKPGEIAPKAPKTLISKAYYSIQADYSQNNFLRWDDTHKKNAFLYGYVGKFDVLTAPTYSFFPGKDSLTGKIGILQGLDRDTLVKFTPGTYNPKMTRYTALYFDEVGDDVANIYNGSLNFVRLGGALLNGQRPGDVNSLWYGTGRQYGGYDFSQNNQFRLSFDASFDFRPFNAKTPHAIEFGAVFEQRVDRSYSISALGLWNQLRLNVNKQIATLDFGNPEIVSNGSMDTFKYVRKYIASEQSMVDIKLREKLGLAKNGLTPINVDTLDPTMLSVNMFAPDELINNGDAYVNYYGYTYDGKVLRGKPTLTDYFKNKNDLGFFTREVGANRPNYMALYLQDNFIFKNLLFNLGVRIDRYDANTKVLKDQYSLYQIKSAGEASGTQNIINGGSHPSNIGNDYAVYVNDKNAGANAQIIGYRNGNTWYDARGVELQDPSVLAKTTVNNNINPYLVDPKTVITDTTFDPSTSFVDFKPQINVMPRLNFSFPINEEANFFAHYDIIVQRPQSRTLVTPDDYMFMDKTATDQTFNNPNLKPERTVDYQLGFQQMLGKSSALTISAFYKDFKDLIQVTQIAYAYPVSYRTFGNKDIANTKGFEFKFEQNPVNNFRFATTYTLQFADGTGSDDASQASLINSGVPNLRTVLPLNSDVRHTFTGSFDFRFTEGKDYVGPVLGKKKSQILKNSGINLIARLRSGEPYSRAGNARNEALISPTGSKTLAGTINGSRLPWNYRFDLRLDKDFNIVSKKDDQGKTKNRLSCNAYLLVTNLLNTKNIQSIYAFTGTANDDGYIGSPQSESLIAGQNSPTAFIDQYSIKVNNPDNYSLPRRIRIGIIFNF